MGLGLDSTDGVQAESSWFVGSDVGVRGIALNS